MPAELAAGRPQLSTVMGSSAKMVADDRAVGNGPYTRADVAALNGLAREQLRQGGELRPDQVVQTERGERAMAFGDRLMFLRNERGLGAGPGGRGGVAVKNGTLGTVLAVEAGGERLTVRLDGTGSAAGAGQEGKDSRPVVTFYVRDYGHVDHGYAATVHKAQGVTADRAHVLASAHMDRHAAYVALTRHRDGVALHYGRDEFADGRQLARSLGRERAVALPQGECYRAEVIASRRMLPGSRPSVWWELEVQRRAVLSWPATLELVRSDDGPHVTAHLIVLWCTPAASSPAPTAHRCAASGLNPDVATERLPWTPSTPRSVACELGLSRLRSLLRIGSASAA